ncbi:MAG: 50S ribosomal protein L11 methyltransferase [Desulfobacterales bacterium]
MRNHERIAEILAKGYRSFDNAQYNDAMKYFSRAMELEIHNEEARLAYNQVIQLVVPRYHFSMLNDKERNDVYDRAIRKAVDRNKTVLDVGTGSGLLSIMAARAGAKRIYACEIIRPIADVAKAVIAANGYSDRIDVINKKSDELVLGVDIPYKLDLLITETIDSALIGEGIIPIIKHAKECFLKDNAEIIPRGARVFATLLDSQEIYEMNHADRAVGLDVSPFNSLSTNGAYPVRLKMFKHKFLCEPFEICEFDFKSDQLKPRNIEISISSPDTGTCHAVAFWFDLYLDEDTTFSSSPLNPKTHWKQAVQCFPEPIHIRDNEALQLSVCQSPTKFHFNIVQPN